MQKTKVIEVVVYEIVPEQVQNTPMIIEGVNQYVKDFDGFISRKVYQSPEDSTVFMDFVEWESLENAQKAAKKINEIKELAPFMESIKSVKFMSHFEEK